MVQESSGDRLPVQVLCVASILTFTAVYEGPYERADGRTQWSLSSAGSRFTLWVGTDL